VIENCADDDARRLGDWLTAAGLELVAVKAYAGEPVPADLDGYAALVVLGGDQHAYRGPDATPGAPWFDALEALLRRAVRDRVPTLAICLGAQLLAQAHAGTVAPSPAGPEVGAELVAKRDAAESDPLFARVPMLPDVIQWHHDEVTELPVGAVLLAASHRHPHQAFRVGDRAWGLQFHIESDAPMIADWARDNGPVLSALGRTADDVVAGVAAVMDDMAEVWQPFAARFAWLARGELPEASAGRELPLLGGSPLAD
jgi:GMP synthase-like glutamine amidotransferase